MLTVGGTGASAYGAVTDSGSETYTQDSTLAIKGMSAHYDSTVWYICGAAAGITSVTWTYGTADSASGAMMIVAHAQGIRASSCRDVAANYPSSAQSSPWASSSVTTTSANEWLVGPVFENGGNSLAASGNWSAEVEAQTGTGKMVAFFDQKVSSTGSFQNTGSDSGGQAFPAIITFAGTNSFTAMPSETNIAGDSVSRLFAHTVTPLETAAASDAIVQSASHFARLSELDVESDAVALQSGHAALMAETNVASDGLARQAAHWRGETESNTAGDSLARAARFVRTSAEANTASDSMSRLGSFARGALESDRASDSLARLAGFARQAVETGATSDSAARHSLWTRAVVESLAAGDALGATATKYLGQPRHQEDVPGRMKNGSVPGRTKTGEAPVH